MAKDGGFEFVQIEDDHDVMVDQPELLTATLLAIAVNGGAGPLGWYGCRRIDEEPSAGPAVITESEKPDVGRAVLA